MKKLQILLLLAFWTGAASSQTPAKTGTTDIYISVGVALRLFDSSGQRPIEPIAIIGGAAAATSLSPWNRSNVFIDPYNHAKFHLNAGIGFDIRMTRVISGIAML